MAEYCYQPQEGVKNILDLLYTKQGLFKAYQTLGIDRTLSTEEIKKIYEERKESLTIEELRAFQILCQELNRNVFDQCKDIPRSELSKCETQDILDTHYSEVIHTKRGQVKKEKKDFEHIQNLAYRFSKKGSFKPTSNNIEYIGRFIQNEKGYWILTNTENTSSNQIDIFTCNQEYIYYIQEDRETYFVGSRDLFYNFNKMTTRDGVTLSYNKAFRCLSENLVGFHWSIICSSKQDDLTKIEFFKNYYGNIYSFQQSSPTKMLTRITDFACHEIYLPKHFTMVKKDNHFNISSSLTSYYNYIISGCDITSKIEETILEDVKKTNPNEVEKMQKVLSRF